MGVLLLNSSRLKLLDVNVAIGIVAILTVIALVIVFGFVKRACLCYFGYHLMTFVFEFFGYSFCYSFLLFAGVKDPGSVLATNIGPLPIFLARVMCFVKQLNHLLI
jgi:hypothetical protein